MARRFLTATLVAVCAALGVVGCSGSTGTHVQRPGNSTPPPVNSSNPSSPAPVPTTSTTTTVAPPSGFGAAQPAVDVVVTVLSAYATAVRRPTSSSASLFDRYLGGQAKIAFDDSLKAAKAAGIAYRGTPPAPRMKIMTDKTSATLPEVVLRNCPLSSAVNPFVAYYVKSGKAVPTRKPKVPQPYAQTAKVFRINGDWVITSFATDNTKTCKP